MAFTTRFSALLTTTFVLVANAAPILAQRPDKLGQGNRTTASAHAGCYSLVAGEWSGTMRYGPRSAPVMVRLDTTIAETISGRVRFAARVTRPLTDSTLAESRFSVSWRAASTDSIEVLTWSDGFTAEVLYLTPDEDGFRGVARRTTDAIPTDGHGKILWDKWPSAPVTAKRIPCAG